jgi:hypothetical protein
MQLRSPLLASIVLLALAWSTSAQARSATTAPPSTSRATAQRPLVVPKPAPRRLVVPEQKPVSYGSVERTKLLSQGRVARNGQHYGSVERRAAIEGQRVQGSRQAPHRRRN